MYKILISELRKKLSLYTIKSDLGSMIYTGGEVINIDCQSMLLPLMYILTREYGYETSYLITGVEETVSDDTEGSTGFSVSEILTAETLFNMQFELREANIYLEETVTYIPNYSAHMAILKKSDFISRNTLLEAFKRLGSLLGVDTSEVTEINEIAFKYVYVSDIKTYLENSQLLNTLVEWGITSFMVVCSIPSTIVEREYLRLEQLFDMYEGIVNKDNSIVINPESPILADLRSKGISEFLYDHVEKLYVDICNIEQEYIFINLQEVRSVLHTCLALAFINSGKKPIFICSVEEEIFLEYVTELYTLNKFPVVERMKRLLPLQFDPNKLIILNNGKPYMAVLRDIKLQHSYKLVKISDIKGFISRIGDGFRCTMPADCCKKIKVFDEDTIDMYNVVHTEDGNMLRYSLGDVFEYVSNEFGMLDMKDYEQVIYLLLRCLEQLTIEGETIKTVGDIIVLREDSLDAYIGFAEINPVCNADLLLVGTITRMVRMKDAPLSMSPIEIIYDNENFARHLARAYAKTPGFSNEALNRLEIMPIEGRQLTKALYHSLGSPTKDKSGYRDMKLTPEELVGLAYMDSNIMNLRNNWLPIASENITSYGLRLLNCDEAPITIYGGINFSNTRGASNKGKVLLYWEAFKRLPTSRKGNAK